MDLDTAIKEVEDLILRAWPDRPESAEVDIVLWFAENSAHIGVRVAEVSMSWTDGPRLCGMSAMQIDPEGLACCALAERCILERMHPDLGDMEHFDTLFVDSVWGM